MKQQYIYFFMALPLLIVNSVNAANVVGGDGPIGLVIKGDNNYFYQSPYSVVAGFSNSIVDSHGGYSDSSDASKVVGSNNSFKTGKNNAVLGDGNTLIGSTNSNASHLLGNNNQTTHTKQSNVLGNSNSLTSTVTVVGNNNNVTDGSLVIGNSVEMIEGTTITIGNGLTVLSTQDVSFNHYVVSGVANARATTDAINVGQLNQSMQQTLNSANDYTDTTFDEAKGVANDYTDQRIYELLNDNTLDYATDYANSRFNHLDKKIKRNQRILNAGIASAMATASVPAKLNTSFSFGTGIGHYRNESALALGLKWGVSKNLALGSAIAFNTRSDTSYSLQIAYGF